MAQPHQLTLLFLPVFKYEKIQELTGMSDAAVPAPDFLFEVTYCDQMNAKFAETRGEQDLIYAFHGSRLENFHSILHNGLHCHLNRVRLLMPLMGTISCWSPAVTLELAAESLKEGHKAC